MLVELSERASEADLNFVWLSDRIDVEAHVLRADHIAAAAMGVKPRPGFTLWSSPVTTDAGLLTRALAREIHGKSLEAAMRMGQHVGTPAWAKRGRGAGWSALTGEEAAYRGEVRSWLEHLGQAWKELSPEPGEPARCIVEGAVKDFQAHAALLLIEGRGKLDAMLTPRKGVAGYEGLHVQWLGPDGLPDTADDIHSNFTVSCGGIRGWGEPVAHIGAAEPAGYEIDYRDNRLVPTQSTKVWLADGSDRSSGPWTSEPLHGGHWWVHAVGLKDSRVHYAAVRAVDLPFPTETQKDYAERRRAAIEEAQRKEAKARAGIAHQRSRPAPPVIERDFVGSGYSLSTFGVAPYAAKSVDRAPQPGGAAAGAPKEKAYGAGLYGPPLPDDLPAPEPEKPKKPSTGHEYRDYVVPSFGVAPVEKD